MLRKKKILTAALCAGGVVLSAALTAAETETTIVSQPFAQSTDDVAKLSNERVTWAGYGSVTNQTVGYAKPAGVGSPINGSTDKLYLSVDGHVTCTAATTESKPATVDMMIQISRPDEALALPSGEEMTGGIQIALGVETDGTLKAYCKNRAGVTGWYALGTTEYAEGEWHRVSFTFDYTKQTCQIRLDGEPLMTTDGYLTSDPEGASAATGSWYKLNTATVKLSSLKVVGSTAIDEVVVKYGEGLGDVLPSLADIGDSTASGVPYQWIAKQGITRAQAEAATLPDNSGMSALQKYQTGLPVGDGKTYVITAMSMADENGEVWVTLTVPKMTPSEGRRNVVVWGTSPDEMNGKIVLEAKASAVDLKVVPVGAPGVTKVYYQLKNEQDQ